MREEETFVWDIWLSSNETWRFMYHLKGGTHTHIHFCQGPHVRPHRLSFTLLPGLPHNGIGKARELLQYYNQCTYFTVDRNVLYIISVPSLAAIWDMWCYISCTGYKPAGIHQRVTDKKATFLWKLAKRVEICSLIQRVVTTTCNLEGQFWNILTEIFQNNH